MTVGGVDTYYDYDDQQWKFRRLGGGPVRPAPACPAAKPASKTTEPEPVKSPQEHHASRSGSGGRGLNAAR